MKRLTLVILTLGLAGCGQRQQQSSAVEAPAAPPEMVIVGENTSMAVKDPISDLRSDQNSDLKAAATPHLPPAFEYPADLTGQAVVKAVAPETPALTPAERFGTTPKPRTPPTKLLSPELTVKANYIPPPILPKKSAEVTIAPPQERVPFDLGRGADTIPAKPTLPIAAAITERARNVNLPPAMPILGRPQTERASLDDPTSDFANAAIVSAEVKGRLPSAEFLKVVIPDPFELGEQVKPKLPPAAEPGMMPVSVDPQRVK